MRLLIVEDDREAASYLVKGLTECGHVVDHAADGDGAVGKFHERLAAKFAPALKGVESATGCQRFQTSVPRKYLLRRID